MKILEVFELKNNGLCHAEGRMTEESFKAKHRLFVTLRITN